MEENKNNNPEKETDRSGIDFRSDADTTINSSALQNQGDETDEMSLADAMGQNPFKLFLLRTFIKVKNHISIIPMILVIVTMIIITCTIQVHVNATVILNNDKLNSFWFFLNVILSILMILAYININSKKTEKKKWIVMMVLFYIILVCSGLIDILYMRDINIELNLTNSLNKVVETDTTYVADSYKFTMVHFVLLIVDAVLAALCPILQPFAKKLHIAQKKK
jgi:hypothetical protein